MRSYFLCGLLLVILNSCSRNEELIPESQLILTDIMPEIDGADAVLISTMNSFNNNYFGEDVQKQFGTATAVFYSNENKEFIDAGNVSIYNLPLKSDLNNKYSFIPGNNIKKAIPFQDFVVWTVEGSSTFPAINNITKIGWPFIKNITHPMIIGQEEDLHISIEYLSDADFISYRIIGPDENVVSKTYVSNVLSHTFSREDLNLLGNGVARVEIEVSKREGIYVNGRAVYFINREILYSQLSLE